jgi:hypothetical protein
MLMHLRHRRRLGSSSGAADVGGVEEDDAMEEYLCAEEDAGVHVDRVLDYSIIAGCRLLT